MLRRVEVLDRRREKSLQVLCSVRRARTTFRRNVGQVSHRSEERAICLLDYIDEISSTGHGEKNERTDAETPETIRDVLARRSVVLKITTLESAPMSLCLRNVPFQSALCAARFRPGIRRSLLSIGIGALLACAPIAPVSAADSGLTWNGITLYGAFDIGVSYQTHGAPLSQDWFVGVQYLIDRKGNKSITSIAPNGLSQSKLGLRGKEALSDDLSFVFDVETGFDPQSGHLADALASLTHNNGKPLTVQTSAGDSSRAGQLFNGPAVAGLSSPRWGTATLGRNNTLLLDNILKYDPMGGSYAFSLIGLSGVVAGMGTTQDARLDGSLKYLYSTEAFHAGFLYQPGKTDSSPGKAWQGNVGFEYAGFSVDGIYGHKNDALSASSLSVAQATTAPHDSLASTISDNTSYTLAGSYKAGPWKLCFGYEHMKYENPSNPLEAGFSGLGGYLISFTNNTAFPKPKVLQASWAA